MNSVFFHSYRHGKDHTQISIFLVIIYLLFRGHAAHDKLNGYTIWGAVVTEVEMDVLTGERNILRCDLMQDTGATINPEVDIGNTIQKNFLI